MAELSQVRNTARSVAEDMKRFDRDFRRLFRLIRECEEQGIDQDALAAEIIASVRGKPSLEDQLARLMLRLKEHRAEG